MVIITIAPSSGAAAVGALGAIASGIGQAKQQQEENERQNERLRIAQEGLKLQQARAQGQSDEQQRVNDERTAGLELDEMRRRGVATPEDIKRKESFGVAKGAGAGPLGAMMGAGGFSPVEMMDAQAKADKQRAALDKVFPQLKDSDRDKLLDQYKEAEAQGDKVKFADRLARTYRDTYRAKDILTDDNMNAALDPHIDALERYLKDPTDEGYEAVQKADQFLADFLEEEGKDRRRQIIGDKFDDEVEAAVNPEMSAKNLDEVLDLGWRVRLGPDKPGGISKDEGKGRLFALTSPEAAKHAARESSAKAVQERTQATYDATLKDLRSETIPGPRGSTINRWVRPGEPMTEGQSRIGGSDWKRAYGQEMNIRMPVMSRMIQDMIQLSTGLLRGGRKSPETTVETAAPKSKPVIPTKALHLDSGGPSWKGMDAKKIKAVKGLAVKLMRDEDLDGFVAALEEAGIPKADVPPQVWTDILDMVNSKYQKNAER